MGKDAGSSGSGMFAGNDGDEQGDIALSFLPSRKERLKIFASGHVESSARRRMHSARDFTYRVE